VIVSKIEGGPGSGKITHCDRLTRIDDRLLHLNMQATFLEVASEIGTIA
jgi:broad-specificity NMP kinase